MPGRAGTEVFLAIEAIRAGGAECAAPRVDVCDVRAWILGRQGRRAHLVAGQSPLHFDDRWGDRIFCMNPVGGAVYLPPTQGFIGGCAGGRGPQRILPAL
mmetsp:Transcript_85081/g.245704  ORF Transcript_85081/g.245704 Transcript_85081/m.245704 type:complete len:100 (+) Transcript_85081:812-1111(+)